MIVRKIWEQEMNQWLQLSRKLFDDAGFCCNFHKPYPEGHDTDHSNAQRDCFFGGIQCGIGDVGHASGKCGVDNPKHHHTAPEIIEHKKTS